MKKTIFTLIVLFISLTMTKAQVLEGLVIYPIDTVDIQKDIDDLFSRSIIKGAIPSIPNVKNSEEVQIINFIRAYPDRPNKSVRLYMDTTLMLLYFPNNESLSNSYYLYSYNTNRLREIDVYGDIRSSHIFASIEGAKYIFMISIFKYTFMPENPICYITQDGKWGIFTNKSTYKASNIYEFMNYQFGSIDGYFNTYDKRIEYKEKGKLEGITVIDSGSVF